MPRIKRICQNLSKLKNKIVGYPTRITVEGTRLSPSPFSFEINLPI